MAAKDPERAVAWKNTPVITARYPSAKAPPETVYTRLSTEYSALVALEGLIWVEADVYCAPVHCAYCAIETYGD